MGMISGLMKALASGLVGRRTWTPEEVREMIDRKELDQASEAVRQLSDKLTHRSAEQACLLGEIAFQHQMDDVALAHFRDALRELPSLRQAHYGLSLIFAERKAYDDAVRHAQFALGALGQDGRYLAQYGYCHLCLGNMQVAEMALRRATLVMSANPYVWNNLGIVMRAKGELPEARRMFELALSFKPGFDSAGEHLSLVMKEIAEGRVKAALSIDNSYALRPPHSGGDDGQLAEVSQLEQEGHLKAAVDLAESLALEFPEREAVAVALSSLYERCGDLDSARDALQAHLSQHREAELAGGAMALLLVRAQEFVAAEPWLREAVGRQPDHLDYLMGLGQCLSGQERFAEAGEVFERALALSPDTLTVVAQLAANRGNECRYEDAMALVDGLGEPGKRIACRGSILGYMGRFEEALEAMNGFIAQQPNDPGLRFQRAQLHLLLENYAEGWDDYAFRGLSASKNFRMLPMPFWRGEPLAGKRIIVLAEQGLGDQVMFASCLPDLLALGPAEVIVEAHRRVATTLIRSFPDCRVIASPQNADLDWLKDFAEADFFVPLPDLATRFRRSLDSFPAHGGYLRPDPARVAHWRGRLESSGPGPYIGVSWKGGTEITRTPVRSLDPEQLIPLAAALPTARWVCLQYGDVSDALNRMASTTLPMLHWAESIDDLDEFASLIQALDLVITVCNTTVHYAGALGKETWVLCPKVPEWRYGYARDSLPWYPSTTVLRQAERGDWQRPLADACQKLSFWGDKFRHTSSLTS